MSGSARKRNSRIRLQQVAGDVVPCQVLLMMPYVLAIPAPVLMARRASYPETLMIPYRKGER